MNKTITMSYELSVQKESIGYDKLTAEKYTAGQEQFFGAEKVEDGATLAMEEEIAKVREVQLIDTLYDLGAGSNRDYLRKWRQASGATAVVGVEPSAHMRALSDRAKKDGEPITVVDGDWRKTRLPDASADMVVSRFSLHHLRDIRDGYAELARILKSGGSAIISLPHPEYCAEYLKKKNQKAVEGRPMSVRVFDTTLHYYYHDAESYLGENAASAGLEVVETKSFNWGTKDVMAASIPNTLLFVLRKK
jgi:ubiquinone/menaquinone biosynthesis C-methylase UbiE